MTPEPPRSVLLSVRPRFAAALLDGTKTVEVRRGRARLARGAVCVLYASSPEQALVGTVEVMESHTADPETIWDCWGHLTGLTSAEFRAYMAGISVASAIVVAAARRLEEPIPLHTLRVLRAGFVTPQRYRYLAEAEYRALMEPERHPPRSPNSTVTGTLTAR